MLFKKKLELVNRFVNCNGCTCCSAGTVYVFPNEVERLRNSGIELIEAFGHYFIPDGKNGCKYNDTTLLKCTIYEKRPLCCRLFPFDIYLSPYDNNLYWVYYNLCDQINRLIKNNDDIRLLYMALTELERNFTDEDLIDFYNMNVVTKRLELGDNLTTEYNIIKPLSRNINDILINNKRNKIIFELPGHINNCSQFSAIETP